MNVALVLMTLVATSWLPEVTNQIPSYTHFLRRPIRQENNVRQGTIREYLPPINTEKPRPFEPVTPERPEDNIIGYPTPPQGVYPPIESTYPETGITVQPQVPEYPQEPGYPIESPGPGTPTEPQKPEPGLPEKEPGYPAPEQETIEPPIPESPVEVQEPEYPGPGEPEETPGYPGPGRPGEEPGYPLPEEPTTQPSESSEPQEPGYPGPERPEEPGYPRPGEKPEEESRPEQPATQSPEPISPSQPQEPGYPRPEEPGYPGTQEPELPRPSEGPGQPQEPSYPGLTEGPQGPERTPEPEGPGGEGYPPAGQTPQPPFFLPTERPQGPPEEGYPKPGPPEQTEEPGPPAETEKPEGPAEPKPGPEELGTTEQPQIRPEEPQLGSEEPQAGLEEPQPEPEEPQPSSEEPQLSPEEPQPKPEEQQPTPEEPEVEPEEPQPKPEEPQPGSEEPSQPGITAEVPTEKTEGPEQPVVTYTSAPATSTPETYQAGDLITSAPPGEPEPEEPGVTTTPTEPADEDLNHPPHIHALDVLCDEDKMTITVEFNRMFNGIIYSKGNYNNLDCRYVNENSGQTTYMFTVYLNQCGTELVSSGKGIDTSYLENVLVMQNEVGIQEVWDTVRAVRCQWEQSLKKSLTASLSVGMLNPEIVTFSGDSIMARLDIQQGEGPFAPTANGLVPIGEKMTLVVSVTGAGNYDIQVKDCKAKDPDSKNEVLLSDEDGCILKPKLFGAFQKLNEPAGPTLAYAFFNAFKFPDIMDLMIECNVELCKEECDVCPDTNQKLRPGRRRRDVTNNTLTDPIRVGKLLRVLLPEDLSRGEAIVKIQEESICVSVKTFVVSTTFLISVITTATIFSAYIYLKSRRSYHKH